MIVAMQMCASLEPRSIEVPSDSGGDPYTVTTGDEQHPATCPCKAYKFSKDDPKICKHIRRVHREECGWHEQWCDERQTLEQMEGNECPRCGGPTIGIQVEA